VGSAIILFNLVIPVRLGLAMELSVGIMLILLGGWNLSSFFRSVPAPVSNEGPTVHSHAHSHGDFIHSHPHVHLPEGHAHSSGRNPLAQLDRRLGKSAFYQVLRPLIVGIVHGLAGSAAVALLILASIRNSTWAIAYLLIFGVGTIAGMMLITVVLAAPFALSASRLPKINVKLRVASGLISFAFGLFLIYQIGFSDGGLFSDAPVWEPH